VYPVGRLDYESEGLLLLTNDGDLAAKLTHPSHGVTRVYEARVLGIPDARDIERLSRGIVIDGRRTQPAEIKVLPHKRNADHATLQLTIREGRNRQVLKPGRWRELSGDEVKRLRAAADARSRSDRGATKAEPRRHEATKNN
jgi:pseudouridine synthase